MPRSADKNELSRERPDAGEFGERGEGPVDRQGAENGGVKPPVRGRVSERTKPRGFEVVEAANGVEAAEDRRPGKRVQGLPGDLGRRAVFPRDAGLDGGGLRPPDPVADDGPGRGLVRRAEADRAQTRVVGLQARGDRVGGADGGEAGAVDVQRQDAGDLSPDRRRGGRLCTGAGRDRAVGPHHGGSAPRRLLLPDRGADDGGAVVGGERQPQHPVARVLVGGGGEAVEKPDGGRQRERPFGGEGEARHGHSSAVSRCLALRSSRQHPDSGGTKAAYPVQALVCPGRLNEPLPRPAATDDQPPPGGKPRRQHF
jgi:hypothetical protein